MLRVGILRSTGIGWTEQEMRLTSTFEKWACEGTVWSAGARRVSTCPRKSCFALTSRSGSRGTAQTRTERLPRTSAAGHTNRWKPCGGVSQRLELTPACAHQRNRDLHRPLPRLCSSTKHSRCLFEGKQIRLHHINSRLSSCSPHQQDREAIQQPPT